MGVLGVLKTSMRVEGDGDLIRGGGGEREQYGEKIEMGGGEGMMMEDLMWNTYHGVR